MHMIDCFYFSKVTRGLLLLNEVEINFKDELFTCLMFKIHTQEIQDELNALNQQRERQMAGGAINQNQDNGAVQLQRMILLSFQAKNLGSNQRITLLKSIEFEVEVNVTSKTYNLRCRAKYSNNTLISRCTISNVPIENKGSWNLLLVHFTKKMQLEIVLKNANEQHQYLNEVPLKDINVQSEK